MNPLASAMRLMHTVCPTPMKYPRILLLMTLLLPTLSPAEPTTLRLWPGRAPGETKELPPEVDTTTPNDRLVAGQRVERIGNVSDPTLTVYHADPSRRTGSAVLVFPGGGYHILATDIEGTEICEWFNSIGVTAIMVKYRVPRREGRKPHEAPLQDAQRALGLVRQNAEAWGIAPDRIGVLGFSAGGNLAAVLSNNHEQRTYPAIDAADQLSCRPDFTVLIYPGYLSMKDQNDALPPELPVERTRTPPTFLAMTQDDNVRVENALTYYAALHRAGVTAEMHLYPVGGHGYGLRKTGDVVSTWPDRVADWMRASGWLPEPGSSGATR